MLTLQRLHLVCMTDAALCHFLIFLLTHQDLTPVIKIHVKKDKNTK